MSETRFATVVIDVDSTLCGLEGIDWLAALRGPETAAAIARLTEQAMAGKIRLENVYGERLALVRPNAGEIELLSRAYVRALAPGAAGAIRRLRTAGVRTMLVSGGIRQAILPVARELGLPDGDVHAVDVQFDAAGTYAGYDEQSPMTLHDGKRRMIEEEAPVGPVLAVGDGATDLAMREAVDAFAAFTGFVTREAVVRSADHVLSSFPALEELVLS